jgi:hypothetical protein
MWWACSVDVSVLEKIQKLSRREKLPPTSDVYHRGGTPCQVCANLGLGHAQ